MRVWRSPQPEPSEGAVRVGRQPRKRRRSLVSLPRCSLKGRARAARWSRQGRRRGCDQWEAVWASGECLGCANACLNWLSRVWPVTHGTNRAAENGTGRPREPDQAPHTLLTPLRSAQTPAGCAVVCCVTVVPYSNTQSFICVVSLWDSA